MAYVYNSQLDAFTIYHQVQEESDPGRAAGGIGLPALGHALAGSAGTAISNLILYPLDLAVTRLQVQRQLRGPTEAPSAASEADVEYKSLQDAAEKIYKREGGLAAFYAGCLTDTSKSMLDAFLFFLAYNFLRQTAQRKLGGSSLPIFKELGVGIAAGAFSKFITTPISQIVTRQKTAALIAARDPTSSLPPELSSKLSVKDIALQIRSERGIQGFWAGYSASLILTLNPALTFMLNNLLTKSLPKSRRDNPGPRLVFLLAAISKAAASTITYPFSLAKTRAQVASHHPSPVVEATDDEKTDTEKLNPPSRETAKSATATSHYARKALRILFNQQIAQLAVLRSVYHVYKAEGLAALYSGLEGEVLKGFLGHGFTMLLKERIHVAIISAYYLGLKLMKRWPEDLGSVRDQAVKEMGRMQAVATNAAIDAGEKAKNIGETVVEGAGNAAEGVKGALGTDNK